MEFKEISNNLFAEDKMMVAVKHEVTEAYINMILRGDRPTEPQPGGRPSTVDRKQLLIDLEFLATQNISMGLYKAAELGVNTQCLVRK